METHEKKNHGNSLKLAILKRIGAMSKSKNKAEKEKEKEKEKDNEPTIEELRKEIEAEQKSKVGLYMLIAKNH